MQYKEAIKLQIGEKVIHKHYGDIILIKNVYAYRNPRNFLDTVYIEGISEDGYNVKYTHKEVFKY